MTMNFNTKFNGIIIKGESYLASNELRWLIDITSSAQHFRSKTLETLNKQGLKGDYYTLNLSKLDLK